MSSQQSEFLRPPTIVITPEGIRRQQDFGTTVSQTFLEFVKAYRLVMIDFRAQSFGLYLGHLWFLLEPALQAGAYYFLLKVIFRREGADATFAFFFIGITFWRSHATLLVGAPYFLISKGYSYIEQGLGLLPAVLESLVSEVLLLAMRMTVLGCFLIAIGLTPFASWMLLPAVIFVQFLFSMALFLVLSILGAVLKDIGRLVGHVVWLWWYLSPGLYSIGRIPDWALLIYRANPFAYMMPSYHEIILDGKWSSVNMWGCLVIGILSTLLLAYAYRSMLRFSYNIVHHV
jgi:ABC-type polysaccharide/polyol phosphate export permease